MSTKAELLAQLEEAQKLRSSYDSQIESILTELDKCTGEDHTHLADGNGCAENMELEEEYERVKEAIEALPD